MVDKRLCKDWNLTFKSADTNWDGQTDWNWVGEMNDLLRSIFLWIKSDYSIKIEMSALKLV